MAQYPKYEITAQRLTGIADQARRLSGTTGALNPAQIVDTLQSVTVAQAGASFSGAASGFLPEVAKGAANSEFTITITSSATSV